MQFGLFTRLPWPENTVPRRLIEEITEQVQYGEALGFQGAWFAEHHFSRYGLGSSSLVLLGALAAQTRTIRLGTAILVPTLHNPIRLAEDIAMVDVVSNGRIDVGFGRGSAGYEYHGYGLDRNESQQRFQESIRMILGLWTTPEYSQQGQFYTINQATWSLPSCSSRIRQSILPQRAPRQRWRSWSRPANHCSWGWYSTRSRRWTSVAASFSCRPRPARTSRCHVSPSYGIAMSRRRTSKRWKRRGRAWNGPST